MTAVAVALLIPWAASGWRVLSAGHLVIADGCAIVWQHESRWQTDMDQVVKQLRVPAGGRAWPHFIWMFHYHANASGWSLVMPLWPAAFLSALLGAYGWRRHLQALVPSKCFVCGYDRFGLLRDTKCPGCGTTAARG